MRKFKILYLGNKLRLDYIEVEEIECVDLIFNTDYVFFLGSQLDPTFNLAGQDPSLYTNRLLLLIPRENLVSLEEIFN